MTEGAASTRAAAEVCWVAILEGLPLFSSAHVPARERTRTRAGRAATDALSPTVRRAVRGVEPADSMPPEVPPRERGGRREDVPEDAPRRAAARRTEMRIT